MPKSPHPRREKMPTLLPIERSVLRNAPAVTNHSLGGSRLMGTNACENLRPRLPSGRGRANRSLCSVNHLHSFFIHPATVHFDCRESSFDLTKIRRR